MSAGKFESWLFGKWGPLEKSIGNWIKDVLWPEGALCCACGRISDGSGLCKVCRESLLHDGVFWAWDREDLAPDFQAWSLRPHDGVPRELVIRLKYHAEARAARLLSELLLPLPPDVSFPPDTVVTWVTMPESRFRDRGIDHGRLLAKTSRKSFPCPAGPCWTAGTVTKNARPPSVGSSARRILRALSGQGRRSPSQCSSSTTCAPPVLPSAASGMPFGPAARPSFSPSPSPPASMRHNRPKMIDI